MIKGGHLAKKRGQPSQSALVRVPEAARRLGVSYPTLKQWIYKGTLRPVRTAGGHYRIAEEEIDRLLSAGDGLKTAPYEPSKNRSAPRRPPASLTALSGRNQLRGIVEEVRVEGLMAQIRLRIGDQRLTAVITRDAVEALRLKRGDEALAVIKSTEVMLAKEGLGRFS